MEKIEQVTLESYPNFWPMLMYQKINKGNNWMWYIDKNLDKDDFCLKNWFLRDKFTSLPTNVPKLPFRYRGNVKTIEIHINTADYPDYEKIGFDWLNVNYFISNFASIPGAEIDYTYWHVESIDIRNVKYIKNKVVGKISYILSLDAHTTFYNEYLYASGDLFIERMHNNRFIVDDIFNTGYLIPDIRNNEFIRFCQPYCTPINQKTQYNKTQSLVSDRNYEPKNGLFLESPDTKVSDDGKTITGNTRYVIYVWAQRTASGGASEDDQMSFVDGNVFAYKLFIFNPLAIVDSSGNTLEWANAYKKFCKDIQSNYIIKNATIGELVFKNEDLKFNSSLNAYELVNDSANTLQENFWLKDDLNLLTSMMFYDPKKILQSEWDEYWRYEPHIYMNNHCEISIGMFNKNNIKFDISNFFINKAEYNKMEYFSLTKSFKLLLRISYIAPNFTDLHHYLLDNDTSVVYKKNTGTLNLVSEGQNSYTYINSDYDQWYKTQQNQRQAGSDAIKKQYQASQIQDVGNWFTTAISGTGMVASGNFGGGIATVINSFVSAGSNMWAHNLQQQASQEKFDAKYADAKSMQNNISQGSTSDGMRDSYFALDLDDNTLGGIKKIYTPELSVLQVKEDRGLTIAKYVNRWGYVQKNIMEIESFWDLFIRRYWNVVKLSNMSDFITKLGIGYEYLDELVGAFGKGNGVTFLNLSKMSWDLIGNWELTNYEDYLTENIEVIETQTIG